MQKSYQMIKYSSNEFILTGGVGNDSLLVAKVTSDGNIEFEKYLYAPGGIFGTGIDKDDSGNFYVISWNYFINNQWQLIKFDASGDTLWSRTINEPTYGYNICYAIVVNSNNIYVVSDAGDSPYYYVLYKFDLDGNSIFNNYYQVNGNMIVPRDVAVDSNGDVIMVGGGGLGWYIIKCNSDGDTLWSRTIQGYGFVDQAREIVIDNNDNITISGRVNRIVKYDTNGNLIYNNTLGGDTNWEFYSLLKYDDNNVIGIGGHRRSNGFSFDLLLGKYSIETGDSVWTDIWIHPDQNYGLYGYDGAVFFDSSLVVLGQTIDATGIYSVIYLMNFAIAYNSVPVELTSFNASTNGDGNINLNWSTATETNNQGFEIERKSINNEFEKIGYVTGYGTTTEPKSY